MGRSKNCSNSRKWQIVKSWSSGKSLGNISKALKIPKGSVQYIVSNFKEYGDVRALPKSGRPRILTSRDKRRIVSKVKENPRITSKEIQDDLEAQGVHVSRSSVKRTLYENGFHGRRPRKTPLHKKKHLKDRLKFAKDHIQKDPEYWSKVLWSDETKVELFGHNNEKYVWREAGKAFNPRNTIPSVKHGGGSLMFWGCFSAKGPGRLVRIDGIMNKEKYLQILKDNLKTSARQLRLGRSWTFQQDRDPKHTSKIVSQWFREAKIDVLEWPSMSPDLNPIEHLWSYLKKKVRERHPKNLDELARICEEEWNQIPPSVCAKLVDTYNNRLLEVIKSKGHATRY